MSVNIFKFDEIIIERVWQHLVIIFKHKFCKFHLNLNEDLGAETAAFGDFGVYYKNNPFLGMFQLKFSLKTFATCSLLYYYYNLFEHICKFSIHKHYTNFQE